MAVWGEGEAAPESVDIDCGEFWPTISTGTFYDEYRIPAELPAATVKGHLQQAVIRVRKALAEYRAAQELAGYEKLEDVPQDEIDETGEKLLLFQRAVYCEAKAEILRETVTVDRRKDAENAAKSAPETEEKYREFAQDAMRLLVDEDRISIELL
ncbi:MAG: head completion/stabilization protein [Lentisphaerota bacterium]